MFEDFNWFTKLFTYSSIQVKFIASFIATILLMVVNKLFVKILFRNTSNALVRYRWKKISSYGSIIKLYNQMRIDREKIQSTRKISDEEIMKNFCCNMHIPPESKEEKHLENFNKILIKLTKISGFYTKVRIME